MDKERKRNQTSQKYKESMVSLRFMKDFEGDLHFTTFGISALKAFYYKFNKARIVEQYCDTCEKTYQFLSENR